METKRPPSKDTTNKKTKLKYLPLSTPFQILETSKISFFPNTPKDANRHHLPNRSTPRPSRFPPTSKQVNNSSRHNPRHTKTIKNFSPQSVSHITVKKKMIYRFPSSLAQATSVHNDDMPLPEIVHSKDLAEIC
jgi:hypothetical protein